MFGTHFYHKRVRSAVSVFGSLFNNIYVLRQNSAGETISQIKVPLSYAPKRNFISRIEAMTNGEVNERIVAIKLPRMSFEINGINYDETRQLNKMNNLNKVLAGSTVSRQKLFTATPYNINFDLNVYAKSQDDALQIVEQIIPYFSPQYTLTIKPFEDYPSIKEDVPITIQSVNFQDDFEGPLEQRRTIIYTLDFTMNINFYGPIRENALINRAIANVEFPGDSASAPNQIVTQTVVTPNPADASPDETFGFAVEFLDDFTEDKTELGKYVKPGYLTPKYVEDKTVS